MTRRTKLALGVLVVALGVALTLGSGPLVEKWKSQDTGDAHDHTAKADTSEEMSNNAKLDGLRVNTEHIFSHSPEWHIKNWPGNQVHNVRGQFVSGIHVWKNDQGSILGVIEYKDGLPYNGIMYVQGASDYRIVQQYKDGKIGDHMNYFLNDGKWELMNTNRNGEFIYQKR